LKIRSLQLENIRSHKSVKIEFGEGITVFTGRTGSGKSTILMAIEYALFGSEAGIPNQMLLRRGEREGKIILEFEQDNSIYRIERGLKRVGKNIIVDEHALKLFKDNVRIPIMARATDLNQKILEILSYPEDCNPKDIFEVTSYTKQDEVRKLIELKPSDRQQFIDGILQLSKYLLTWENMRELITKFRETIERLEGEVKFVSELRKEMEELILEQTKLEGEVERKKRELGEIEVRKKEVEEKLRKLNEHFEKVTQAKIEYASTLHSLNQMEKDERILAEELKELDESLKKYGEEKEGIHVERKLIELQMERGATSQKIELLTSELGKLRKELEAFKKLGTAPCPTCKQMISSEHRENVIRDYEKSIEELEHEISELQKKFEIIQAEEKNARKLEELENKLREVQRIKEDRERRLRNISESKHALRLRIKELEKEVEIYDELAKQRENLQEEEKRWHSSYESTLKEIRILETQLSQLSQRIKEKREKLAEMNKKITMLEKLRELTNLLSRLREDIKSVREVVRNKFLDDFRAEFQRFFEEIRREGEYHVDISSDYEPIAYTKGGEEVPISNLSGGEKTSIALSYRLALANIAAQISGIKRSELLILDEPTTGFDKEDIKALPEVLRNLRTIPQIVIVTHEDELKAAGDHKYEVEKIGGVSRVSKL